MEVIIVCLGSFVAWKLWCINEKLSSKERPTIHMKFPTGLGVRDDSPRSSYSGRNRDL